MEERTDRWRDKQTHGGTDRCTDELKDKQTDGQMDRKKKG